MAARLVLAVLLLAACTAPVASPRPTLRPVDRVTPGPTPVSAAAQRAAFESYMEARCGRPRDVSPEMRTMLLGDDLAVLDEQTRQAQKRWDAMTPDERQADRTKCQKTVTRWMSSGSCVMPAPGERVPECMRAPRP